MFLNLIVLFLALMLFLFIYIEIIWVIKYLLLSALFLCTKIRIQKKILLHHISQLTNSEKQKIFPFVLTMKNIFLSVHIVIYFLLALSWDNKSTKKTLLCYVPMLILFFFFDDTKKKSTMFRVDFFPSDFALLLLFYNVFCVYQFLLLQKKVLFWEKKLFSIIQK